MTLKSAYDSGISKNGPRVSVLPSRGELASEENLAHMSIGRDMVSFGELKTERPRGQSLVK